VELPAGKAGLGKDSVVLTEQIRTIDKSRLMEKVSLLQEELMFKVNHAIEISLGLVDI